MINNIFVNIANWIRHILTIIWGNTIFINLVCPWYTLL